VFDGMGVTNLYQVVELFDIDLKYQLKLYRF